ncbi:unnamed protein product [Paramecium octaurelia]|uniref:Uncharacterized protein n=1 Tax=Paramecium octaurelia TaxID=43137 RepID=A0A8S1XD93_PAROT|nr:unnamed protein product [Paramecium octaurelia]
MKHQILIQNRMTLIYNIKQMILVQFTMLNLYSYPSSSANHISNCIQTSKYHDLDWIDRYLIKSLTKGALQENQKKKYLQKNDETYKCYQLKYLKCRIL